MRNLVRRASVAVFLTLHIAARPVLAQSDDDRAGARAAAEEGARAFEEQRYSDAVDLFVRAESLVHSPVHLLYTARALEKLGFLVRAREAYIKIVNEDLSPSAPGAWKDAKAQADTELDALKPKIPSVTVVTEGAGSKPVTVTMDGVQMKSVLLGVPRPVDPGEHKFEAVAEGMSSGPVTVSAQAGHPEKVVLTLKPSGSAPVAHQQQSTVTSTQATTTPAAGDQGGSSAIPPYLPWIVLGVGVAGVGVGTIFALKAKSNRDDLSSKIDANCTGPSSDPTCPSSMKSELQGLKDDGDTAATIATVGFIAGGVAIAAGGTLLLLSMNGGGQESNQTAGVQPFIGLGSAGVFGTF
jgi:hypothetical protein